MRQDRRRDAQAGLHPFRTVNGAAHPPAAGPLATAQQFRNLNVVAHELAGYLLHDRDAKFTAPGDALLGEAGAKVIRLTVQSHSR